MFSYSFQIQLSFLYVGHTHEDIDAGFSRISDSLRQYEAETLPDLLQLLPEVTLIKGGMFNVSGWLDPHISAIKKHTVPLHYKFMFDGNSYRVLYKGQQSQVWKRLSTSMLQRMPQGEPVLIPPDFSKVNIEKKCGVLGAWKNLFTEDTQESSYMWWKTWLNDLKQIRDNNRRREDYMKTGSWILPLLPRQPQIHSAVTNNTDGSFPSSLQQMLDDETAEPEVRVLFHQNLFELKIVICKNPGFLFFLSSHLVFC